MPRNRPSYIERAASGAFDKGLPDQADVYTVPELTEVSVGWMMDNEADFVHTVFASIGSKKQQGKYRRYKPGSLLRNKMERRSDGGQSAGAGFETDTANFATDVWAWHTDIGPQLRANAEDSTDIELVATEECSAAAMINREVEWVNTYFKAGVWSTQFDYDPAPTGGERLPWNDAASDPIKDQLEALEIQRKKAAGKRANVIVYSADVWERLKVHPLLRTLWGAGQTPGGPALGNPSAFKEQLRQLLEVDEIRVARALYTTSADGDPAETFDVICPTGVGMFYRPARPSRMTPAAGYTFNWTGYAGAGERGQVITREVIPLTRGAVRYEIEQAYGFQLVSADCGAFLPGVLAGTSD